MQQFELKVYLYIHIFNMKKFTSIVIAVVIIVGGLLFYFYSGRALEPGHSADVQPVESTRRPGNLPAPGAATLADGLLSEVTAKERRHQLPFELTLALNETSGMTQLDILEKLETQIRSEDPAAVADWMSTVSEQGDGVAFHVMIFLMKSNPQAAAIWFGNPQNQLTSPANFFRNSFVQFASNEPEQALQLVINLPEDSETRRSVTQSAIYGLSRENLPEAIRRAGEMFDEPVTSNVIAIAFAENAGSDPRSAMAALESVKMNATTREKCISNILKTWVDSDPVTAAGEIAKSPPAVISKVLQDENTLRSLARSDPGALARLMQQLPQTAESAKLATRAIALLAASQPAIADKLVEDQAPGPAKDALLTSLYQEKSKDDFTGALESALARVGNDRLTAIKGIIRAEGARNVDATLDLVTKVEQGQQQVVYREVAKSFVYGNSAAAVRLLEDPQSAADLGAGFRSEMLDHTVQVWAKQDLDSAKSWVEKLQDGDRASGVRGLMNPWMKSDPVAASEWLGKLPAGSSRDAGAKVIIEQVKDTDPQMAEQWRKSLSQQATGKN